MLILWTKTHPEVYISILTPMKTIQLAKSPQPVNNFRPALCPCATHVTNVKKTLKSNFNTFNISLLHHATTNNNEAVQAVNLV